MNALEIEIAVALHFNARQNVIVPNVSWGLGFRHECDLLVVSPKSRHCREIEIKTNAADIKRDLDKDHGHYSPKIRQLYFAVPEALAENTYIPERAGVLAVTEHKDFYDYQVRLVRPARVNKNARCLTESEYLHLLHLASMRIWSLKRIIFENIVCQGEV